METFSATRSMMPHVAYVSLYCISFFFHLSFFYYSHTIEHSSIEMILQTIEPIKFCSIFHFDFFIIIQLSPPSLHYLSMSFHFVQHFCSPPGTFFIFKIYLFTVNMLKFHFCHCHSYCHCFFMETAEKCQCADCWCCYCL